jgi:tetratricopeptide (TPR) repeat protein
MSRRTAALAAAMVLLAVLAGLARAQLERLERSEIPASLLYLPKGPYLRALALGHEETLASLIYIWSIQFYSSYDREARFDYLTQVYEGAITELDPRFTEAYLVGAMIMSIEARRPDQAVALLDKALEHMPDNWEVAYWAGWECYHMRDYLCAREYWSRAAEMPGAPPYMIRLAARMLEKAGDPRAAVREYQRLLEQAPDEKTRRIVGRWLDRALTELALEQTRRAVDRFEHRFGRCPRDAGELVARGLLSELPRTGRGEPLVIDPGACEPRVPQGTSFE